MAAFRVSTAPNPATRIGRQIGEALRRREGADARQARLRAIDLGDRHHRPSM